MQDAKFKDRDWDTLLARIQGGKCTPFLGAAVNQGILPLGAELAAKLAEQFDYPFECEHDAAKVPRYDLAKVAQYVAIQLGDAVRPKEIVLKKLDELLRPIDFNDDTEPLNVVAKLPIPVYITTNYDDLLSSAIEHHGRLTNRAPNFEISIWNENLRRRAKPKLLAPSVEKPLVFHLHGHKSEVRSIVLTEDDYLDYIVNMTKSFGDTKSSKTGNAVVPSRIQEAITDSSLLFMGYSLADPDFRILFRGLKRNIEAAMKQMSVAVQLPYATHPSRDKVEEYMMSYFEQDKVRIYWGTAKEFGRELWDRWQTFNSKSKTLR